MSYFFQPGVANTDSMFHFFCDFQYFSGSLTPFEFVPGEEFYGYASLRNDGLLAILPTMTLARISRETSEFSADAGKLMTIRSNVFLSYYAKEILY